MFLFSIKRNIKGLFHFFQSPLVTLSPLNFDLQLFQLGQVLESLGPDLRDSVLVQIPETTRSKQYLLSGFICSNIVIYSHDCN
jgi:hypothetical protein